MKGVEKKGSISEEDVSLLLQRYSAPTILALLQEVSQVAGVKIDWKTLVKRTTTGISSAREYQTLWRHLAYRQTLPEKLEDCAEPLDDNSDLEFEVEAVPAVSGEASSEAVACVKVLIASGLPHDSCPTNRSTVEAPLTINLPNDSCVLSEKQQMARCTRGMNITVPVSVQKQPQNTGPSAEVLDENGTSGSGLPAKKKRKLWTKEEDQELIAAVEKCGEGNWANIVKGDFKHDRTASQLAQRWAIIRKRQGSSNPGGANKSSGSTRSEERLAAQKAITLFIDMPMTRNSGAIQSITPATSSTFSALISEAPPISAPQALAPSHQVSDQATSQQGTLNPSIKPRTTLKRPAVPVMPPACPNTSIQAAAFAAGGRIAAPSTAASLFKAAQSKSAVHIRPVGGAPPRPPVTGGKVLPTTNTPVTPVLNLGPPVLGGKVLPTTNMPAAPVLNLGPPVPGGKVLPTTNTPAAPVPNLGPPVPGGKVLPTTNTPAAPVLNLGPPVPRHVWPTVMPPPPVNSGVAPPRPGRSASSAAVNCAPESNQSEAKSGTFELAMTLHDVKVDMNAIVSPIDVDELLTVEAVGADEMELDGAAAPDQQTSLQILDLDENDTHVFNNAGNSRAVVDAHLDPSKSGLCESQSEGDSKAGLVGMEAAEDQAMVIGAGGAQITAEKGTGLSNGYSSESRAVDDVTELKQDVAGEQFNSMEVSAADIKDSLPI